MFTGDRGSSVDAMSEALTRFVLSRTDLAGIVGAGGSGGTALITPAMRALPGRRAEGDGVDGGVG